MMTVTSGIHHRLLRAFQESDDVIGAILIGSAAVGAGDQYSDLDYFLYATEPNWPREKTLKWLQVFDLEPTVCYWSGVEKYHMVIDRTGVDFSIRSASQRGEVRTWPTIHFPDNAILKDVDGLLRDMLRARELGDFTASLQNTLHGCLYHSMTCAIQLKRGELVNARSRFSGVIESYICLLEGTVVRDLRWREPSRRLESRLDQDRLRHVRALAYSGSPEALRSAILEVLEVCETHTGGSMIDLSSINTVRALLGPVV